MTFSEATKTSRSSGSATATDASACSTVADNTVSSTATNNAACSTGTDNAVCSTGTDNAVCSTGTANSTSALLAVRNLCASAGEKEILHGVDMTVNTGETHVLMGPNGAGKSTLGHVVMGDPAFVQTAGSIFFNGEDISQLSPDKRSRKGIFLSFQAPVEIPGVPLSSFLRASLSGREERELKGKEFRRQAKRLCQELDLDPAYLDRELGVGFSGGEKKKVEMLQLLLLKPKLAILDETDSGLDVDALGVVSRGMELYRESCNGALIVITHNTRILEHLDVDRIHVMVRGRIVREDTSELISWIDKHGFESFEESASDEVGASNESAKPVDSVEPDNSAEATDSVEPVEPTETTNESNVVDASLPNLTADDLSAVIQR